MAGLGRRRRRRTRGFSWRTALDSLARVAGLAGLLVTALSLVGCDVDRDRVILSGSVPSYHMKQLAQVFALRVEGVDRIDNRLEVHERPKR